MLSTLLAFLLHNCSAFRPEDSSPAYSGATAKNYKIRDQVKTEAYSLVGARYKYAGTTPRGFDCSGFTSFVLGRHGVSISRSSSMQAREGQKIPIEKVLPGDLIFFSKTGNGKVSHVALVVSNSNKGLEVVHSTTSRGVIAENITQSGYWNSKILFARDVIGK